MDWFPAFSHFSEGRFGPSAVLDYLPHMQELRSLRAPLHALGGLESTYIVDGREWRIAGLPPNVLSPGCTKIEMMVRNDDLPQPGTEEGVMRDWKILKCHPNGDCYSLAVDTWTHPVLYLRCWHKAGSVLDGREL